MTKIISKFKNSFTGEVYQIGAGEGGGATDPAIVEQIYANLRKEIEDAKYILQEQIQGVGYSVSSLGGEVNQLITRVNQLEGYRDSFTLSRIASDNTLDYKVILENVPSGTYIISSDWNLQCEVTPDPYDEISVVAIKAGAETPYDADTFIGNNNVLEVIKAPLDNNTATIQVNEPFDLVVYLANKGHIEDIIESYTPIDVKADITATINIKVVKV